MKDALKKIVSSSEITKIWMRSSSNECFIHPSLVNPREVALSFNYEFEFSVTEDKGFIICFVTANVLGDKTEKSPKEIKQYFNMKVCYGIAYELKDKNIDLKDEALEMFLRTTVFFAIIPYIREHVQSVSLRMEIPPVIVPLLKPKELIDDAKAVATKEKNKTTKTKKSKKENSL